MAQVIAQLIVVFGVLAVITYVLIKVAVGPPTIGKREQLRRYWKVEIGMSEYEMLDIMGDGYNRSLLQNNSVRRHIVGGANRTLFSVDLPPRLCRTGT